MERLETRRANVGGSHVGRGDELHQPERDLGIRQRCDVRAEGGELAVERGWDVELGEIDVRSRELLREKLEVLLPLRSATGRVWSLPGDLVGKRCGEREEANGAGHGAPQPHGTRGEPRQCRVSCEFNVGAKSLGGQRKTLGVLFLVNVLNIYDRQALGAVLEPLRREFHLTDGQLGAIPTAFIVVYALAGVPLGRLVDRWSRKRLLAIAVAVWAALTGLGGLAASFGMLLATRLGVGIGEAVCAPAAASWIGDLVPPHRRARAMAWFMMAVPVGVMLSFAVSGPAAQVYGWRVALALAAAPAALLAPALLWLSEPARTGDAAVPAAVSILRMPALWWIAVSGAVVNFVLYSFSYFIAAFLTRFHGLSVAHAGVWSGIGSGAAGVAGALAAGAFGDRARGGGRLRFAAWAALAAAPLAYFAISLPRGTVAEAIALLMAAYGLWQMYYGLVYAAIQDLVGPALRGTAMAVYFLIMYLCGGAFGPLLVGSLSDRLAAAAGAGAPPEAARAAGLHGAMYVIPTMSLVLAVVLWVGARYSRTAAGSEGMLPPKSSTDTGGL